MPGLLTAGEIQLLAEWEKLLVVDTGAHCHNKLSSEAQQMQVQAACPMRGPKGEGRREDRCSNSPIQLR